MWIIITKNLTVLKISILRLIFLSIIICIVSYIIFKNTSSLSPSENTIISFILSVLTSIIFEVSIFRNVLIDNTILGEIFLHFENGNELAIESYYSAFLNRFSNKYRKINLAGEIDPINDLSFLFRVYKITLKEECHKLDFNTLIESYNEIKTRATIFKIFGIDFTYLYSTLVINSLYTKFYIKEVTLKDLIIDKNLSNNELEILFDLSLNPIEDVKDIYLERFIINTRQLKELISYLRLPDKEDRLLPIIKEYLTIFESLAGMKNYSILNEHVILQLTNCFHFSEDFKNSNKETCENLIKIVTQFGFNDIQDLIDYCRKYIFKNELIYILNNIDSDNHDKLLDQIYENMELLRSNYPNIVNIAILNKLAYSLSKSFDFFFTCYEKYSFIFIRNAISKANYEEAMILYDSIYKLLKEKVNPELIVRDLINLEEVSKNSSIKLGGGRNALVISLFTGNNELINELYIKYSVNMNYISMFQFNQIIYQINRDRGGVIPQYFYTMFWYPVQLILEGIFIPFIDREYFFSFFKTDQNVMI